MSESLADWLSLRESADARARSAALTRAAVDVLPPARPLRIVDLGSGTGSNVRYLTPMLPSPQDWLVVDRDPKLLEAAPPHVVTRVAELGTIDDLILADRHLVTASALLDLVSADWIATLANRCRTVGAVVLFALTYDGRFSCSPSEAEDEAVREWFNGHQRASDKGFGQAAGPDAVEVTVQALQHEGYSVRRERSDWDLLPDESAMQRELIIGWASAACEFAPDHGRVIRNWLARRLAHVDDGRSRIQVGHYDVAAWPAR